MASFRDRFLTRRVARTMTSPSAILLAGAGTAGTILALGATPIAPLVGAVLYGIRVAAAMDRKPKSSVDLRALTEPWRTFVADAIDARSRYGKALDTTSPGPLKERLTEIGRRLDDGVEESWRIARRGMALDAAMRQLDDPRQVEIRLENARRTNDGELHKTLQSQLDSTRRIIGVANDARRRLQLLDARLDEAVARAVELALSTDDAGAIGGLGSDVDAVVGDMEALRQALEETNRPSSAVGP